MRLPDPVIPHPYREIEISRPDPNMFLEHEDGVTEHNTEIHNHVTHNYEQRQAAMEACAFQWVSCKEYKKLRLPG